MLSDDMIRESAAALAALSGISQARLGRALQTDQSRISRLLRGRKGARLRAVEIAQIELTVGVPLGTAARIAIGVDDLAEAVANRDTTVTTLFDELDEVARDLDRLRADPGDTTYRTERIALAVEHLADLEDRLRKALHRGESNGDD